MTGDIQSASELAKLVEKNRGTVGRWLKRPDWTFGPPPWKRSQLPDILNWVANTLLPKNLAVEADAGTPGRGDAEKSPDRKPDEMLALRKAKLQTEIRKLHAQADAAETELAKTRGKLLDAEAVESEWAALGVTIRNGFANLSVQVIPLALTHGMPHQAAAIFQGQVEAIISGILRNLSGNDSADSDQAAAAAAAEVDQGSPPATPVRPDPATEVAAE